MGHVEEIMIVDGSSPGDCLGCNNLAEDGLTGTPLFLGLHEDSVPVRSRRSLGIASRPGA